MGDCLCERCAGLCCRYFALPIDNPETPRQFDDIRWYLLHENVTVFVEKKQWYIGIANRCKVLQPDNRCGVYETRPKVCRGYSTDNCDYHGGEYGFELLFTSAEQLERYAATTLRDARSARARKAAKKRKRGAATAATPRRPRVDLKRLGSALTRRMADAGPKPPGEGANGSGNGNGHAISLPLLRPRGT